MIKNRTMPEIVPATSRSANPWEDTPSQAIRWLTDLVDAEGFELWIGSESRPRTGELLLEQPVTSSSSATEPLSVSLPADNGDAPCWRLRALVPAAASSSATRDRLHAALAHWRTCFDRPSEEGLARLLLTHDNHLLYASPAASLRLLRANTSAEELISRTQDIISQRWISQTTGIFDLLLDLGVPPLATWVVLRRSRDNEGQNAALVELRHAQRDELPVIELLDDERIARSLGMIHSDGRLSPSLDELAHFVHVSPFHFHRVFSKQVGISPKQYVLRRQMQIARWLLRTGRSPISEVASRAGFSSHGHFTTTFRRVVGESPVEHRERLWMRAEPPNGYALRGRSA